MDVKVIHNQESFLKNSSFVSEASSTSKDREPTQGGMYFQQDMKKHTLKYESVNTSSFNKDDDVPIKKELDNYIDISSFLDNIKLQRSFTDSSKD